LLISPKLSLIFVSLLSDPERLSSAGDWLKFGVLPYRCGSHEKVVYGNNQETIMVEKRCPA
jgi:hypothetical protein